ncbi:hypothetical protein [Gracilibacillus saliphilus]|uniref:hypothetical protein n=1 Tax=Gracilibacillus saliphilus TaxID=543890 RepID=UPI0013CFD8EC|nr:hypothetical protein [Gracilibacillus saliphilus]
MENNKVVNEKEWKDVTELEEGMIYDMETNVNDYIEGANRIFHEVPDQDSKLIQAGHDEAYYYYLEAMALDRGLDVNQVEGVSLEKDFDNLQKLLGIIVEGHHKRTEHIDPEKYGANKREAVKDWEEPSKRMNQAIEYTKQLLNDIDVAINKDGEGETFGVAFQTDGQKTKELEEFIESGE